MTSSRGVIKKVLLAVLVILLIAIIAGVAVFFVKGPGRDILDGVRDKLDTDFKVEYEGEVYKGKDNYLELPETGDVTFRVKNAEDVHVSVEPAVDFEFSVDGETKRFRDIKLTGVFIKNSDVHTDYLVVNCTFEKYTLENVLRELYGAEAEITVPEIEGDYLYKFVFRSGEDAIEIAVNQINGSITLDTEHYVFWEV